MGRENQGENQGERRLSDSARTQNTTTTHSATHPNINKYFDHVVTQPTRKDTNSWKAK